MQASFKRFFLKDSMFTGSIIAASILWLGNAVFNFCAKDYRAFCINLLYFICLITMYGAWKDREEKVLHGSIGALMMIFVVGNINVLTEILEASVPSRALWQIGFGTVLTLLLFFNHFMIQHEGKRTMRLIQINQIIVLVLLLFRAFQIVTNVAAGGFSLLMFEMTVGLLAIIPTLNAIVCIELKTEAYGRL